MLNALHVMHSFLHFCCSVLRVSIPFYYIMSLYNTPTNRLKVNTNSPVHTVDSAFRNENMNRRNYMLLTDRKDGLIDWMKDMLYHSFVLDEKTSYLGTMQYFESLIEEHRCFSLRLQNELNDNIFAAKSGQSKIDSSRLKQYVPSVGVFFTPLPLLKAFKLYDEKYCISERNFVAPSFNEIRHILNLAQIMVIIPYNYYIYFYMSNFLGYWN